jgi:hypothetical protein
VGGYSWWDWVSIILVEELYGLKGLNFCQNPPKKATVAAENLTNRRSIHQMGSLVYEESYSYNT